MRSRRSRNVEHSLVREKGMRWEAVYSQRLETLLLHPHERD